MKYYNAGWPAWRFLAKMGVPIRVKVMVFYDDEAKVYVATNSNLRGLVAEAETFDGLVKNINAAARDLLESYLHEPPNRTPLSITMNEACAPA
jgi:predicted RNase H-like HicB family nuclease